MENACLHSQMQRSYISVRISDVNIMAEGPLRVAEAAQTRLDIYRRQDRLWTDHAEQGQTGDSRQARLSLDYTLDRYTKFCLEFSVLNDARYVSKGGHEELWGIVRTFAHNRGIADLTDMSLNQVFSYRCNAEHTEDIAKHYGLRLLEKTVQLNGGLFSVLSPGMLGQQTRYSSFSQAQVKKCYDQIKSDEPTRNSTSYFRFTPIGTIYGSPLSEVLRPRAFCSWKHCGDQNTAQEYFDYRHRPSGTNRGHFSRRAFS